jgi:hypothetical protein
MSSSQITANKKDRESKNVKNVKRKMTRERIEKLTLIKGRIFQRC